jgi:hypothetical protein
VVSRDLAIFAFGSGDLIATFRRGGLRRMTTAKPPGAGSRMTMA